MYTFFNIFWFFSFSYYRGGEKENVEGVYVGKIECVYIKQGIKRMDKRVNRRKILVEVGDEIMFR